MGARRRGGGGAGPRRRVGGAGRSALGGVRATRTRASGGVEGGRGGSCWPEQSGGGGAGRSALGAQVGAGGVANLDKALGRREFGDWGRGLEFWWAGPLPGVRP